MPVYTVVREETHHAYIEVIATDEDHAKQIVSDGGGEEYFLEYQETGDIINVHPGKIEFW